MSTSAITSIIEAEASTLGSILLDPGTVYLVRESLSADDFHSEIYRIYMESIYRLVDDGTPIDISTVYQKAIIIANERKLPFDPDICVLTDAMARLPSASNIETYVNILVQDSKRRKASLLMETFRRTIAACPDETDSILMKTAEDLISLAGSRGTRPWKTFQEVISEAIDDILNPDQSSSIPTGFVDLDAMLSGLRPGTLTIIAGRPAMGKTAFGLNILYNVCVRQHIPSAIFSLEMENKELVKRMFSFSASINGNSLKQSHLSEDELSRLLDETEKMSKETLLWDETPGITVPVLSGRAKQMQMRYQIRFLVADYIGLMQGVRKNQNRQEEVAEMSRSLKGLAKELKIPIVVLAQLNRNVEGRIDKRPLLSDLRESGGIEQDADTVLLIHREDYYNKDKEPTNEAEIIIAKQRSGPTGTVKLRWTGELTRFDNICSDKYDGDKYF